MKGFVVLLTFFFCSCVIELPTTVTLIIPEKHPFEEESGAAMWYTMKYFDGEEIKTQHLPVGKRKVKVKVKTGGLRVFTLTPMGKFSPIGGFYEMGDDNTVSVIGEDGYFAQMLLLSAESRSDAVSNLSVRKIKEDYTDLSSIDEVEFMYSLFSGDLVKGKLKTNEKQVVEINAIPDGLWVSERYDVESIEVKVSGRVEYISLFPGAYYFANFQRNLLLSVILTEEGETSVLYTELPVWY